LDDRVELARVHACAAVNAVFLDDIVFLLALDFENCMDRTISGADGAANALVMVDRKREEVATDLCGAAFVVNMFFVLVPKIAQGRQYRVRRGLSKTAEAGVLHHRGEILKFPDIISLALALADPLQNVQHLARTDTAGRAFPAALVAAEFEEEPRNINHAGVFVHYDEAARAHDGAELL